MYQKPFLVFCICSLLFLTAAACGYTDESSSPVSPFTEIGWESTTAEVIAVEGDHFTTYDSVYGGICYTFPKEFEGRQGSVKYMFDDKERLMCIAWTYGCQNNDELLALYENISTSLNETYGESGYSADHPGNYGNVWYLESGDIVLTTMITTDNKALQYAYLHPLVSNRE